MRGASAEGVQRAGDAGQDLAEAGSLADCAQALAGLAVAETDGGRIDQIRALEDVKAACAAAQARVTAAFAASQRAAAEMVHDRDREAMRRAAPSDAESGVTARGREAAALRAKAARLARRSAAAQVALARRESPALGGRFVGLADALVHEMPLTLAALAAGVINEARATIIVRETACLSVEQRGTVDAEIVDRLEGLGDARLQTMVRKAAYRLEPEATTRRAMRAARERRVSVRPAPDAMAYLTLLLPLASAVACYGQLRREADSHAEWGGNAGVDTRTSAQRMADIAVARIMQGALGARDGTGSDGALSSDSVLGSTTDTDADTDADYATANRGTRFGDPVAIIRAAHATSALAAERFAHAAALGAHDNSAWRAAETGPKEPPRISLPRAPGMQEVSVQENSAGTNKHAADTGTDHPDVGADTDRADTGADETSARDASPPGVARGDRRSQTAASGDSQAAIDARESPLGPTQPGPAQSATVTPQPESAGAQASPPGAGVVVNLVISDSTLLAGDDTPAHLNGNLPIPAPLARRMIAGLPHEARVWIRRLYARPDTGQLVAMDSRRRVFPAGMRQLLFSRDLDTCRTPWCTAPARHADHMRPHAIGGATSIANGQSLSEDCNYTRTAPGWSAEPDKFGDVIVTTPTGHRYRSPAPEVVPPRPCPAPPVDLSWAERVLWKIAS